MRRAASPLLQFTQDETCLLPEVEDASPAEGDDALGGVTVGTSTFGFDAALVAIPFVVPALAFGGFDLITDGFNAFLEVAYRNNWAPADGGASRATYIIPILTGICLPAVSFALGTLTATTVSNLRTRQISIRSSLNAEACTIRSTHSAVDSLFPAGEYDDDRRKAHRAIRAPDRQLVAEMLGKNSPVDVLRFVNAEVFGEHTQRLSPSGWLVDEVVNYYMFLLQERDALVCASDGSRKPCHFFNSFFFTKLLENGSYNYRQVKRWTKRFDLFSRSKVFAPVNVGNMHWCMVMVDVARKEVRYFDSMGAGGEPYLKAMKRYLEDEHRTKKGSELEGGWTLTRTTRDTPRQTNGYDCGVFASFCAHYMSLTDQLDFSQDDIQHFRIRMMVDILNKRIHTGGDV